MTEYERPNLVKDYNSLEGLKEFMSVATTVSEYNELREDAKRFFSKDLINKLDQSAYIVKLLGRYEKRN
jgi:hypothetical protein